MHPRISLFKVRLSGVLLVTALLFSPVISSATSLSDISSNLASLLNSLTQIQSSLLSLSTSQQAQVAGISGALSIAVTSPNGGEALFAGNTKTITWTSSSVIDKVSIGWSTGPGSLNWIANNIPNTNSYNWNVNVGNTTNTQFKIWMIGYQTGTGSISDESDNFFSVYPIVNKTDLEIFKLCFGKYVSVGDSCYKSDFDSTGFINGTDLILLKSAGYDFNGDNIVDLRDSADNQDLSFIKSCFFQSTASLPLCAKADLDGSGFINSADLSKFKSAIKYDLNGDSRVDLRESTITSTPPTIILTANPTKITTGQSSTLTLSSTNTTSCNGANFSDGKTSGTSVVSPTQTTTYTVTCWELANNSGTSVSTSAVVFVSSDVVAPPNPSPYQLLLDTIGPNPVQAGSDLKIGGGGGTGYAFTNSGNSVLLMKDGQTTIISDVYGFSGKLLTAHLPPGFEPGAYSVSVRTGSGVVSTNSLSVIVIAPPTACVTFPCFYDGKSITNSWGTVDSPPEYISAKYPYEFKITEETPVTLTLRAQVWASENVMYIKVDGKTISTFLPNNTTTNDTYIVNLGTLAPGVHILEIYASPYVNHFHIDWFKLEKSTSTSSVVLPSIIQNPPDQTSTPILPTVPIPSISLSATPAVTYNGSASLTWSTVNAKSCKADGGWSGEKGVLGSETVSGLTLPLTTFFLTCVGDSGSKTMQVSVISKQGLSLETPPSIQPPTTLPPVPTTILPKNPSADALQARINALLKQLADLQNKLGGATSTPPTQSPTLPPVTTLPLPGDIDPSQTNSCTQLSNNMKLGSRDSYTNGEVTKLQRVLILQGHLNSEATGYFGYITLKAVRAFQTANGLDSTGYIGPLTRAKIGVLTCN